MSTSDNSGSNNHPPSDKSGTQITVQKAGTTTFPINLASAKVSHVKTANETIKVAPVVQATAQQATATFRTIGGGGQSSQVRVVMPPGATIVPQTMIKQIESGAGGVRTQITAIPARTISQTSITVTRPATPTTYIPRANVTAAATSIQTQRLSTPIRTPTPPTATGISGSFIRGTTVARNTSSPATTVISPTTATWMTSGTGQVQLIRTINHPSRQRIIAQNMNSSTTGGPGVVTVGQAGSITSGQSQQQQQNQSNIQSVNSQQPQQTYVATLATVLPPRQQTATLVYSNVSNTQGQQFTPTAGTAQRFTVAAALAGNQRQMRPIQLSSRTLSTAKLGVGGMNTSISIRAPNIPVLTPTLNTGNTSGTIQARGTSGSVNLPTTSLSTTRIIQLQQQQPGTGAQQIIGSTGRLTSNLMLQPIIMNATAGNKISIRPPTTIATKVQPSLTITQVGIGKLSTAQQSSNASTLCAANIQGATITPSSSNANVVASVSSNIVQQSNIGQQQGNSVNVSNSQPSIAQIVNVNQQNIGSGATAQIITAQGVNVPASATVVPLAITSRATNVLTGTITPIKSGTNISNTVTVPPIAKVLPQQSQQQSQQAQVQQQSQHHQSQTVQSQSGQHITEIITSSQGQHHQPTGVFIHTRPPSSGNASGTATVIPSSGTFLPASGTTFYYESVPANPVTVSTGVLSLTTTTVTSTISNSQTVTSTNLTTGIVSSIPYTPSPGTFTVVPSSSKAIGQIQIPVSSSASGIQSGSQIQTVPLRFSAQHISDQVAVSVGQQPPVSSQGSQQQHHQVITMTQQAQQQSQPQQQHPQAPQVQQTHMIIPMQTSLKIPMTAMATASPPRPIGATTLGTAVNTAFIRKRDIEGSPIRAAKNLGPTLLSMSSGTTTQPITVAALAEHNKEKERERPSSPHSRPGSSGGSTTVSANSSPGVDQQISEEANAMGPMNVRVTNESHFNPINDMYPNHQNTTHVSSSIRNHHQQSSQQIAHPISSSNGIIECPPRKKSRRPTNESQYGRHQQQQDQHQNQIQNQQMHITIAQSVSGTAVGGAITGTSSGNMNHDTSAVKMNSNNAIVNNTNNKENAKPAEIILKKPRTCSLLDGYKLNWKAANNHFQRYSDVKPREERRPTVMDLANQSHVTQKINGWKIYHLSAQMEDLCETESQVYDKLTSMLKQLESHDQNPELDRVNDLIKGNMQRSKIIVDGVNEAKTQIMKIFDHKSHVSDIINRCASKRNFKKREKL